MKRRAMPAAISPQWSIVARSMGSTISLPLLGPDTQRRDRTDDQDHTQRHEGMVVHVALLPQVRLAAGIWGNQKTRPGNEDHGDPQEKRQQGDPHDQQHDPSRGFGIEAAKWQGQQQPNRKEEQKREDKCRDRAKEGEGVNGWERCIPRVFALLSDWAAAVLAIW